MSYIVDEFKPSISTIEEVKKLQELVRKLELQNLHLRNKQISNKRRSKSPVKEHRRALGIESSTCKKANELKTRSESNICVENASYLKLDEYFDDLEIIRVSDIELSDDESWLYSSPSCFPFDKKESPYKWLRKDVDDLENKQLQLAKKALISKLNELEILSPSSKLNTHILESNRHIPTSHLYKSLESQAYSQTPLSSKLHTSASIDTRTFTRSQKKEALHFLDKLDIIDNGKRFDQIQSAEPFYWKKNDTSLESLGTCHVLEDANDVQEVARMQEESLRMNSPMGTSNRCSISSTCSSASRLSTARGSISDQDFSENSTNTPSAENTEQILIQTDGYYVDPLEYSNHSSSSSESHYDSNLSLHESGKETDKLSGYRRSLPNLNSDHLILSLTKNKIKRADKIVSKKHPINLKVLGPEKELRSLKKSSPLSLAPRQSKNILHLKKEEFHPYQNSSPVPNISQGVDGDLKLNTKSCLPRPSRGYSASRSIVRSGIPAPSMLNKKRRDDTWSEGCF